MADHPYEISWVDEDGKYHAVIRFGRTAKRTLDTWKRAEGKNPVCPIANQAGVPCEACVQGTVRGGLVYTDTFYYHNGHGPQSAPLSGVTGLRYTEQGDGR